MAALLISLYRRFQRLFSRIRQSVVQWTRPTNRSLFVGTLNGHFAKAAEHLEVDEAERRRRLAEALAFLQHALIGGKCPAYAVIG